MGSIDTSFNDINTYIGELDQVNTKGIWDTLDSTKANLLIAQDMMRTAMYIPVIMLCLFCLISCPVGIKTFRENKGGDKNVGYTSADELEQDPAL
jgi:hypothetical protein